MNGEGQEDSERIVTVDLLRLFLVFAIVMLHTWEHFIGEDLPSDSIISSHYDLYASLFGTIFNYAALYAVSLSFLLWGWKNFRMQWVKMMVLALGMIGLQLRNPQEPFDWTSWTWEVYGYLFVGILLCRIWPKNLKAVKALGLFSIAMLSIPLNFWMQFAEQTVEPWRTVLFANRETSAISGWFLIPWIFVTTLAYSAGQILYFKKELLNRLLERTYLIVSGLSLAAFGFYFIKPNPVPPYLGMHFYQFLFMQSAAHFWNHFLLFIAILIVCFRLETIPAIKDSWLKYLKYFQWNQNFFLCYFFHFSVIVGLLRWKDELLGISHSMDWLWIVVFLVTEILMQIFVAALKIYILIGQWFFRKLRTPKEVSEAKSS